MKRQIDKYNEMMQRANMQGASFNDMQVSTLCCIAENTAIIADALGSRQQDYDAAYLANRICEIAKKYTDGDLAMTEIGSLLQEDILGGTCIDDFRKYFENRRKKIE